MWVIIWNRAGFLVPFVFGLAWLLADHISSGFPWPERMVGHDLWRTILGVALGGYANWRLGRHLNADEDSSDKHRLYFIPMEIWGLVGLVASIGSFCYFAQQGGPVPGLVTNVPPPDSRGAQPAAAAHNPLAFLSSLPPIALPTASPRTSSPPPVDSAPVQGEYKLSAIIRSGSDPSRWLFEVVGPDGGRHFARCGEQVDAWTVTAFTTDVLILSGDDGRSQQLRVPRSR